MMQYDSLSVFPLYSLTLFFLYFFLAKNMDSEEYYDSIDLHIRWSDRQDLILRVSTEDTIYIIKEKV